MILVVGNDPANVRATLTGCNVKSGRCVITFELDMEYRGAIPDLAMLAGKVCNISVSQEQMVILVDGDTGEVGSVF